MAISLISPGIKITESDLVSSSQAVSTTSGAFAGQFRWGPIDQAVQVTNETELVERFGKPNATNVVDFLTAANFLGYSGSLFVVRSANTALNSTAEATTGSGTAGTGTSIKNDDVYINTASFNVGPWAGRYSGALGNALKVSVCPSSAAFSSALTGTYSVTAGSTTVTGSGTAANTQMQVGDFIVLAGRSTKVVALASNVSLTIESAHLTGASAVTATRRWEFFGEFDSAPGTSTVASAAGASGDELHVVVQDRTGDITGTANTVIEKFGYLSKASNAKADAGGSNYYKDIINDRSSYVWWAAHDNAGSNWGNTLSGTTYTAVSTPKTYSLAGGSDGTAVTDGDRSTSYVLLSNKQEVPFFEIKVITFL
jgi:hypothetical protein